MRLEGQQGNSDRRVPRLVEGCDPTTVSLSPAEGYLLSRIDGRTPCHLLREIGGIAASEVDACLERLAKEGLIELDAGSRERVERATPRSEPLPRVVSAPAPKLPPVDPGLDLSVEVQERVLEISARLDRPYHEILGVDRDADVKTIKRTYFALSKVFHPDRYFRRETGPYAALIEEAFKKILEAYELLSDPATRAQVQANAESVEATHKPGRDRLLRRLEQLSGRRRAGTENILKAKTFFEAGMAAFGGGRFTEAASNVKLALAFDPDNLAFRERFAQVQRAAHGERAQQLKQKAAAAVELRNGAEAFRLLDEACHLAPGDAALHQMAAEVGLGQTELRRASEFAQTAVELLPDDAAAHCLLGRVYAAAGLEANARRELKRALELDPQDPSARAALRAL